MACLGRASGPVTSRRSAGDRRPRPRGDRRVRCGTPRSSREATRRVLRLPRPGTPPRSRAVRSGAMVGAMRARCASRVLPARSPWRLRAARWPRRRRAAHPRARSTSPQVAPRASPARDPPQTTNWAVAVRGSRCRPLHGRRPWVHGAAFGGVGRGGGRLEPRTSRPMWRRDRRRGGRGRSLVATWSRVASASDRRRSWCSRSSPRS